jgi:DNA replication protein DnaC
MLIHQSIDRLHEMRLLGMAEALEDQQRSAEASALSFDDRIALLIEAEKTYRENRRLVTLLRQARLKIAGACPEDVDFSSTRGLDRSVVLALATCEWVRADQVVLVIGPTGVGKTYLACALGHAAARAGLSVRYFRLSRLLGEMALAKADGSYPKLLARLAKTELLILDDFGLAALGDTERRDLLEILEDRYSTRATLVTSQLPTEHWHEVIGDPTIADAILDRLVHGAHRIEMKGESRRKTLSKQSAKS